MKSLILLVALFGLTFAIDDFNWDKFPSSGNFSQCVYREDVKLFSCRGLKGIVECPVVLGISTYKFDFFGLGFSETDKTDEFTRFWLYPRSIDNITYANHSIVVNEKPVELVLYYDDVFTYYGFRITDLLCYSNLISLFRFAPTETHMVPLESKLLVKPTIGLFSEILVIDKDIKKRWLGGWGLGGWGLGGYGGWGGWGGYGGWGWGGYGLGYGGYGLGYGLGYGYGGWGWGK